MEHSLKSVALYDTETQQILSVLIIDNHKITKAWVQKSYTEGPARQVTVTINPKSIDPSEILALAIELECVNSFIEVSPRVLHFTSLEELLDIIGGPNDEREDDRESEFNDEDFEFDDSE